MTITVHHLEYSRSLRILWALEELELDYTIREYKRDANFRAPDSAREVHPLGRFPMLEIDGHILAESGAVLEYLAEREGKLRPESDEARREYTFFLHYAEGSAMPPLLVQLIVERLRNAPLPFFIKPLVRAIGGKIEGGYSGPAMDLHLGYIDRVLGEREYFAGDEFSLADVQMFYPVEAGLSRGQGKYGHMQRWRDRVAARPAYATAEAKGGKAVPAG